uniref:Uncharacterized protein n=1 Tax=Arundo donax TaxID=35708 RepID=A0A0A9GXX3_ARUDO
MSVYISFTPVFFANFYLGRVW